MKAICRYCKLSPPHVTIPILPSGKSRGECLRCRADKQTLARNKSAIYKGLVFKANGLFNYNYKALSTIPYGAYRLMDKSKGTQVGYIVIKNGAYYVSLWNDSYLVRPSLFGMATLLSDFNLVIESAPITLLTPQGAAVDLESIGVGMPIGDIADRLAMFDLSLQERVYKRLKRELADAKAVGRAFNKPL